MKNKEEVKKIDKLTKEEIQWLKDLKSIDAIVYPDGSVGELRGNFLLL